MKVSKALRFAVLGIALSAMLLPVAHFVNLLNQHSSPAFNRADGAPFPPIPPKMSDSQVVADGAPFPPIPPRGTLSDGAPFPPIPPGTAMIADGAPFPPIPPRGSLSDGAPFPPIPPGGGAVIVADGAPFPPIPPRLANAEVTA